MDPKKYSLRSSELELVSMTTKQSARTSRGLSDTEEEEDTQHIETRPQICCNATCKGQTCISKFYLSLSCCKRCGLHFEDAYEEQLFLDNNYFRSKTYIGFSSAFAILQLMACACFLIVINTIYTSFRMGISNIPIMIGFGIDGVLLLVTHLVEVLCMSKGKLSVECAQLWHIARMAIGCTAAASFYMGGFISTMHDVIFYEMDIMPNKTIDDTLNTCLKISKLHTGESLWQSSWNNWICAFFAQGWEITDFVFASAGPQTLFLHALPARLSLPILSLELVATFGLFFVPSLRMGSAFSPVYLFFYQACFALGLGLVTITAELESRRNFKGQANWRILQTNFLRRLSMSDTLEAAMLKDCPAELNWVRKVGNGTGLVPLHEAKIELVGNILISGNLRRAMHGEDLENLRIPGTEIKESDEKLGRGGQANVYKGRWKQWNGRAVSVAIKKWGSRNPETRVDELAMYQNEVKVLIQLKHRYAPPRNILTILL